MTKPTLPEALAARTGTAPVVIAAERARWLANELAALAPADSARFADAPVVALRMANPAHLVASVVALQGHASAVLLLPSDVSADVAGALLRSAGVTLLISDEAFEPAADISVQSFRGAFASASRRSDARVDTNWMFATSGTTGVPKLVRHSFASLTRTTLARAGADGPRWGLLYDPCRFAGFQVVLQALLGGGTLIAPDLRESVSAQLAFLALEQCSALSCTPTMWRKLLMTPGHEQLALRQLTLGGEIADDATLSLLARAYPSARVTHVYASSEAGVGFSVKDGRAGFPGSYLVAPPNGIELRIADDRLQVRNRQVSPSYVCTGEAIVDNDGFVDTGDMVRLENDRVTFLGRASGVVNVGGNKVYPEEVETVLNAHDAVQLARVSGKSNPIAGQILIAEVVPTDNDTAGHKALKGELVALCQQHLPAWKRPALFRMVSQLPRNATGKLIRQPL